MNKIKKDNTLTLNNKPQAIKKGHITSESSSSKKEKTFQSVVESPKPLFARTTFSQFAKQYIPSTLALLTTSLLVAYYLDNLSNSRVDSSSPDLFLPKINTTTANFLEKLKNTAGPCSVGVGERNSVLSFGGESAVRLQSSVLNSTSLNALAAGAHEVGHIINRQNPILNLLFKSALPSTEIAMALVLLRITVALTLLVTRKALTCLPAAQSFIDRLNHYVNRTSANLLALCLAVYTLCLLDEFLASYNALLLLRSFFELSFSELTPAFVTLLVAYGSYLSTYIFVLGALISEDVIFGENEVSK